MVHAYEVLQEVGIVNHSRLKELLLLCVGSRPCPHYTVVEFKMIRNLDICGSDSFNCVRIGPVRESEHSDDSLRDVSCVQVLNLVVDVFFLLVKSVVT